MGHTGQRAVDPAGTLTNGPLMAQTALAALVLSMAACVTDLRSRRIPNVLTFGGAAAALAFHLIVGGPQAFLQALLGWTLGAAIFFPPFALGGLGGGDIKLLAALGAWLGPLAALWLAIYTSLAGAVMALAVALAHGYLGQALRNMRLLLTHWRIVGFGPLEGLTIASPKGLKLAYALPILVGTVLTIWLH
jgi:prepilin peptidase CpaA